MINENKMDDFESHYYGDFLNFQLNNYDLLDLNMSDGSLYYSRLNNHYDNLRNDLPSTFYNKFQNISYVYVYNDENDKPIDADNLNWFLNNLKCLKVLIISDVSFDQHFFNNLPKTIYRILLSN